MSFSLARACLVMASLALCSCSNGAKAEKQYHMMEEAKASSSEICLQGEKVAQAYLEDGNQAKYEQWRLTSEGECAVARLLNLRGQYGQ